MIAVAGKPDVQLRYGKRGNERRYHTRNVSSNLSHFPPVIQMHRYAEMDLGTQYRVHFKIFLETIDLPPI